MALYKSVYYYYYYYYFVHAMQPVVTDVPWCLCLCVSLLVMTLSSSKTALNRLSCHLNLDSGGPKESRVGWGSDSPLRRGNFGVAGGGGAFFWHIAH